MQIEESKNKELLFKSFDEVLITLVKNPITGRKNFLLRNISNAYGVLDFKECISAEEITIDGIKLIYD